MKSTFTEDFLDLLDSKGVQYKRTMNYLVVGGRLSLRGRPDLPGLPKGLIVCGDLDLPRCTGITALPEDLIVGRSLYLNGCTGLITLPAGLKVGSNLHLDGCSGLLALPGLAAVGSLHLSGEEFYSYQRGAEEFNEAAASYRRDPEAATTAVLTYGEDHWRSALARAILGGEWSHA